MTQYSFYNFQKAQISTKEERKNPSWCCTVYILSIFRVVVFLHKLCQFACFEKNTASNPDNCKWSQKWTVLWRTIFLFFCHMNPLSLLIHHQKYYDSGLTPSRWKSKWSEAPEASPSCYLHLPLLWLPFYFSTYGYSWKSYWVPVSRR